MLHHDLIPYLKPAEMLAWMAQNPLLLQAYPELCAQRAAELLAGKLTAFEVSVKAGKMSQERAKLRLKLCSGYEGSMSEQADWQRIEELMQAKEIEAKERGTVRAFGRQCHASEWPWLIARMEEVITRRAGAQANPIEEPAELAVAA